MGIFKEAVDAATIQPRAVLRDVDESIWWKVLPICIGAITAMWFMVSYLGDWGLGLSIPVSFAGFLAIWHFILKPKHIELAAFIGAVFNMSFNPKKVVHGAFGGVTWLVETTAAVSRDYLFLCLVLWTLPFHNQPGVFWIGLAGVIILSLLGPSHGIKRKVMGFYTVGVLVMATWSLANPVYHGVAFDPCTGQSLHLVDPVTGNIEMEMEPTTCDTPLYSTQSGEPLRFMTKEEALDRAPSAGGKTLRENLGAVYNPLRENQNKSTTTVATQTNTTSQEAAPCLKVTGYQPEVDDAGNLISATTFVQKAGCSVEVDASPLGDKTRIFPVTPAWAYSKEFGEWKNIGWDRYMRIPNTDKFQEREIEQIEFMFVSSDMSDDDARNLRDQLLRQRKVALAAVQ